MFIENTSITKFGIRFLAKLINGIQFLESFVLNHSDFGDETIKVLRNALIAQGLSMINESPKITSYRK